MKKNPSLLKKTEAQKSTPTIDPLVVREALVKRTHASFSAADEMIDLSLTRVLEACYDKELNKKIMPFATVYTMDVLKGVFGQK